MKASALLNLLCLLWLPTIVAFSCRQSRRAEDLRSGEENILRHTDFSDVEMSRRTAMHHIMNVGILLPYKAHAETDQRDGSKPYAPMKFLLPATRVKVLIDDAVETANNLAELQRSDNKSPTRQDDLIANLKSLLLEPQSFMTEDEKVVSTTYLKQRTWGDWKKARQKETQTAFDIQQVDPVTSAVEAFEQWGERGQFKRLQKQRVALDDSNKMRAAFNAYTNNLVFGSGVQITASKEEKSRLIRTYDQLPDVTSTIRSDLDLRDLYRNQVLTAFDDAKAELEYQLKSGESFDATEILTLLRAAQKSCLDWFDFIPEKDVAQALYEVKREQ